MSKLGKPQKINENMELSQTFKKTSAVFYFQINNFSQPRHTEANMVQNGPLFAS